MSPELLYTACALGAVSLLLMLRPGRAALRLAGALVGLAVVAWMLVRLPAAAVGDESRPELFFTLFSLIAVASAVRMITHTRPVYAALYFILVVLSSAALFLLMAAEFMAFALIIVYAGAILITYLFVLMLAHQQADPGADATPEYDRVAREPLAAALVGFLMLALLTSMAMDLGGVAAPPGLVAQRQSHWHELERMDQAFRAALAKAAPELGSAPVLDERGSQVRVRADGSAFVLATLVGSSEHREIELPDSLLPDNTRRVGYALVAQFPVSLELAGVILTLAMFGAVVLARKQIELGEDELREAAGLPRYAPDDDPELEPAAPAGGSEAGGLG